MTGWCALQGGGERPAGRGRRRGREGGGGRGAEDGGRRTKVFAHTFSVRIGGERKRKREESREQRARLAFLRCSYKRPRWSATQPQQPCGLHRRRVGGSGRKGRETTLFFLRQGIRRCCRFPSIKSRVASSPTPPGFPVEPRSPLCFSENEARSVLSCSAL